METHVDTGRDLLVWEIQIRIPRKFGFIVSDRPFTPKC